MITGMSDSKLPPFPFPRDSKAPLDTPPAYSEGPGRAPAPAPREPSNAPPVQPQAAASNPFSQPTSSASMASRAAPQQFTHAAPPAPLPAAPVPPSPSPPGPHAYPRPADASSYQSSSSSETKTRGGRSPGATVARAVGQGVFALVAMPVVATAAALYGSGKLVEGIGRGLSAGPGAVLRAYRRMDGRIKGGASGGGTAARGEKGEEEEERWRRYQYQHQQQQQRYPYEYGQGEGGVGAGGAPVEEGLKPKLGERSVQMPMQGSLMEDPSVGMAGGSGSIRAKN